MKFTKMSLVAALLVGSSAFAIENTKVSGDAKVYYSTMDAKQPSTGLYNGHINKNGSLFDAASSAADIAVSLDLTTDLYKNSLVSISAGGGVTTVATLGLENSLVNNVWAGSHQATAGTGASYGGALGGAKVENAMWVDEAWVAVSAGKSTIKLGRMELDTPNAFTETWSVEKNTFEAAVLINQDIPDTTLVAAFVGNGNGTENFGQNLQSNTQALGLTVGAVVNQNGQFGTYGTDGAYAAAVINNSFKPLTVQAWYYDVTRIATSLWLQADLNMNGMMFGAQYNVMTADSNVGGANVKDNTAYALMAGYTMKDTLTAKVAYSKTNKDGTLGHVAFNTATNAATAQSKLYTEAWWNYGYVTTRDTSAINVSVTSPVNGLFDLGVYYTDTDQSNNATIGTTNRDLTEIAVSASKSFGPLDATLVYLNTKANDQNVKVGATKGSAYNTVQAYLTVNF